MTGDDVATEALRVNLRRIGLSEPQLDQALAEVRDSFWLAQIMDQLETAERENRRLSALLAQQPRALAAALEAEIVDRTQNDPPSPLTKDEKRGWRLGMTYAKQIVRAGGQS